MPTHYFKILLLFWTCFLSQLAFSQPNSPQNKIDYIANVQHFSLEDGLSHRNTKCTYQDRDGFIWVGTQYGLNRFDGRDFKLFTKEHNGLPSNEISQIFQDADGWIWVFTSKGLVFLNSKSGKVENLNTRFGGELPFSVKDLYHVVINEENKTIFLGTIDGQLFILNAAGNWKKIVNEEWENVSPSCQISDESLLLKSDLPNQSTWFYEVNFDGEILNSFNGQEAFIIGQDKQNNILGYFRNKSPKLEIKTHIDFISFPSKSNPKAYPTTDKFQNIKEGDWTCRIYYRQNDHTFWFKNQSRFFVFRPEEGILFDFNVDFPEIAKNIIQDIYFDNSGNAWVSTEHGFYNIQLMLNPFRRFLYNPSATYDVNTFKSCRVMTKKENNLWVGTESKGNYKIELTTSETETLPLFIYKKDLNGLMEIDARLVFQTASGKLIFGNSTLFDYQISDRTYNTIYWKGGSLYETWSAHTDLNGKNWIGTYDGPLGYLKPNLDSIYIFKDHNGLEFSKGGFIYTFLDLDKNHLLIGTSFGIFLLNHQKGILKRYWTGGEGDAYFPSDLIYHLKKDKTDEKVIWVATGGGGLVRWNYPSVPLNPQKGENPHLQDLTKGSSSPSSRGDWF